MRKTEGREVEEKRERENVRGKEIESEVERERE